MIEIAKILKPHGLKGEVKLEMFNKDVSFWHEVKNVYIDGMLYAITSLRFYKGFLYLTFSEVNSIDEAERLRNKTLKVDEEVLRKDGEYLIQDLINADVYDDKGDYRGRIESVERYGSADIINLVRTGASFSFPYLKNIIISVDTQNKRVVVSKKKLDEVII